MRILAIETSCDETAAAVIEIIRNKEQGTSSKILSNVVSSQIEFHKKFGGVFPEHASRLHAEKIIEVAENALRECRIKNAELRIKNNNSEFYIHNSSIRGIDLIAVTTGPGLIGSLLIGVNFAKSLAYATGKPIVGVNHLLGHIYSSFVADNLKFKIENLKFPMLSLIVSGGHTSLVLMKSPDEIQTLGETQDDAAGEAFDKVAKLLGLGYPGGPAISAAAEKFRIKNVECRIKNPHNSKFLIHNSPFSLPRPMINSNDYNFSFSGLKTAVLNEVKNLDIKNSLKIAYEFQQAVIDVLISKTMRAAQEFHPKAICLCGGVSANKELRKQMQQAVDDYNSKLIIDDSKIEFYLPPVELSTDNAAMIGLAAAHINKSHWTTFDKIKTDPNLKL